VGNLCAIVFLEHKVSVQFANNVIVGTFAAFLQQTSCTAAPLSIRRAAERQQRAASIQLPALFTVICGNSRAIIA